MTIADRITRCAVTMREVRKEPPIANGTLVSEPKDPDTAHATLLIVPAGLPVAQRVDGDALTVLHTVVSDWVIE